MCGIAGVVTLGPNAPAPTPEAVRGMAEALRHRGPDGRAIWGSPSGRCVLGHARLKVIDLETGDQPMRNEDGSVQAVFNGEIYNFQALRAELEAAGHRFRTRSDTEVIVHGFEEWGQDLPSHLDGMFALAVWDEPNRALFLARDRAGQKPLFWTRVGDRLAFASEIKALRTLDWVETRIDPTRLPYYLSFGYVPGPETFFHGIQSMPPASRMLAADGRVGEPESWWTLDWRAPAGPVPDAELAEQVRSLLRASVQRRLIADVPLGAFLSGGIDSTLIVGLMRELVAGPIRTFSLGFADDRTYDESAYARESARRFDTDHTEFTVEAQEIDRIADLVHVHDQPFGDSSALPTHLVSELTREHVTVALTGDGGDEMFAGYPRFLAMTVAERLPGPVASAGAAVARRLPYPSNFRHPLRRVRQFFDAAASPPERRMLQWAGFFGEELGDWLRGGLSVPGDDVLLASYRAAWQRPAGGSALARTLSLNFSTYLPEDLLVKADRCSMAHGLELRSPFLDTRLMEFAAGLPDRARIRGHRQTDLKWLLRNAFPDLLTQELVNRGKMGFGVPLPMWFRTHWKARFEDLLIADGARTHEWLDSERIRAMWTSHQTGSSDHAHRLWALLTLESWLRAL